VIEEHLRALRENKASKSTVQSAERWLQHFWVFCRGRCPSELKSSDLVAWHKELIWIPGPSGKLYSESSINQAIGAVRRFYRWALLNSHVQSDPTNELITRKAEPRRTNRLELTPAEARKLLASPSLETPAGIRDRAIFAVLLETGISRPACASIDLGHLQLDTGALLTRGRSQQIHSLSHGALADLERYLREARPLLLQASTPALFLNTNGDRISAGSIQQTLRHHRQLAGL
jgi:integrase/recombinase XerD